MFNWLMETINPLYFFGETSAIYIGATSMAMPTPNTANDPGNNKE